MKDILPIALAGLFGVIIMSVICYTTDSPPIFATSPTPISEIRNEMAKTSYIQFLEVIGKTESGEILFTFKWSDYGLPTGISASNEERKLSEQLKITRLQDYPRKR